jgi:hypothetical protein
VPNHWRFVTLELPDSLAINPLGAGHTCSLNERLRAWQGVGGTIAVDEVPPPRTGVVLGTMMDRRHVVVRLHERELAADALDVAFGAP